MARVVSFLNGAGDREEKDLGPAVAKLDGKELPARKYKLSGQGVDDEWWFDGTGRSVRQNLQ